MHIHPTVLSLQNHHINKKTLSDLFVFVFPSGAIDGVGLGLTIERMVEGLTMGGGAPGSLPCWGFLFLLVTRRSPRTGLPRET